MRVEKLTDTKWGWKVEYEGNFYGEIIEQQEGKSLLTEEIVRRIGERRWAKDLGILNKFKKMQKI